MHKEFKQSCLKLNKSTLNKTALTAFTQTIKRPT